MRVLKKLNIFHISPTYWGSKIIRSKSMNLFWLHQPSFLPTSNISYLMVSLFQPLQFILKDAGTGGRVLWHQDYGYWYDNGCLWPDMGAVFIPIDRWEKKENFIFHSTLKDRAVHKNPSKMCVIAQTFFIRYKVLLCANAHNVMSNDKTPHKLIFCRRLAEWIISI